MIVNPVILATLLSAASALILMLSLAGLYRVKRRVKLPAGQLATLQTLAERALASLDVPVGAILVYEDAIIGAGYNTVLSDGAAAGHAEINAISDALRRLGAEKFAALDRRMLVLISTFEPCLMCAGACINNNIRQLYFLKEKDFLTSAKECACYSRYLIRRKQSRHHAMQEELFARHPHYPGRA